VSVAVLVIAIIGVFFLVGIAFGVLAVIAGSALRGDRGRAARKRTRLERFDTGHDTGWTGAGWTDTTRTGWEEPPGPDAGGEDSGQPRWPGGPSGR